MQLIQCEREKTEAGLSSQMKQELQNIKVLNLELQQQIKLMRENQENTQDRESRVKQWHPQQSAQQKTKSKPAQRMQEDADIRQVKIKQLYEKIIEHLCVILPNTEIVDTTHKIVQEFFLVGNKEIQLQNLESALAECEQDLKAMIKNQGSSQSSTTEKFDAKIQQQKKFIEFKREEMDQVQKQIGKQRVRAHPLQHQRN